MRTRSLLLLALLGVVVAAAPGTGLSWEPPPERKTTKEGEPAEQPERSDVPGPSPVFLSAAKAAEQTVPVEALHGDAAATPEVAPALRGRRLAAAPRWTPPVLPMTRDVRAGLLSIPPPAA